MPKPPTRLARHLLRAKDLIDARYGIDAPFRDPFGNEFRMMQVLDETKD